MSHDDLRQELADLLRTAKPISPLRQESRERVMSVIAGTVSTLDTDAQSQQSIDITKHALKDAIYDYRTVRWWLLVAAELFIFSLALIAIIAQARHRIISWHVWICLLAGIIAMCLIGLLLHLRQKDISRGEIRTMRTSEFGRKKNRWAAVAAGVVVIVLLGIVMAVLLQEKKANEISGNQHGAISVKGGNERNVLRNLEPITDNQWNDILQNVPVAHRSKQRALKTDSNEKARIFYATLSDEQEANLLKSGKLTLEQSQATPDQLQAARSWLKSPEFRLLDPWIRDQVGITKMTYTFERLLIGQTAYLGLGFKAERYNKSKGRTEWEALREHPIAQWPATPPPPPSAFAEDIRALREDGSWDNDGARAKELMIRAENESITESRPLFQLGLHLYGSKCYEEALYVFRKVPHVSDPDPGYPGIVFGSFVWQGQLLDLLGRREEAVDAYKKALELAQKANRIHKWRFVIKHDQWGLRIDQAWVEERLKTPYERK